MSMPFQILSLERKTEECRANLLEYEKAIKKLKSSWLSFFKTQELAILNANAAHMRNMIRSNENLITYYYQDLEKRGNPP